MDRKNIVKLAGIIGVLTENDKPSTADLDFDDAAIDLHDAIYKLKDTLEAAGY